MKELRTKLTELLGIALPIIQAPIGSATCPKLAAAVSNAGGLGTLALTWKDLESTRRAIRETRAQTDHPFGVNLVLEWDQHKRLDVCLEEQVPVISFFWKDPSPYLAAAHKSGAIVMQTVGSAPEAKRMVDIGVDVIVAQGWEAGGHVWGQVATMALVPSVVDAVAARVPVVAAGGIADGRGVASSLALGAAGVWIGTRFLASEEAQIHPAYRNALLKANETDPVYTTLFDGGWPNAPHRVLKNSTFMNWRAAGCPPAGQRPREGEVAALLEGGKPSLYYDDAIPFPGLIGDAEAMALYAGQSVGLVSDVKPAATIVREIAEVACLTIHKLNGI
jgi:nitronate monooxygenase